MAEAAEFADGRVRRGCGGVPMWGSRWRAAGLVGVARHGWVVYLYVERVAVSNGGRCVCHASAAGFRA